jgi:hypothetical protein
MGERLPPERRVEIVLGDSDHVARDEGRTLSRAVLRPLEATLPFQRRPAAVAVLRKAGEYRAEVDRAVTRAAVAAGAVDPGLETAERSRSGRGAKLRILHVKGGDQRCIGVDETEIVHPLQDHVAGIIEKLDPRVIAEGGAEALEGHAVVHVAPWMRLDAQIDAGLVERVDQWTPAPSEFGKALGDQSLVA